MFWEAEELWNNWFTVKKIDCKKIVQHEQERREAENRPIRAKTANESEMANTNEVVIETERTAGCENDRESKLWKQEKQTIRSIIASINERESEL